jgi:hypothetical protein
VTYPPPGETPPGQDPSGYPPPGQYPQPGFDQPPGYGPPPGGYGAPQGFPQPPGYPGTGGFGPPPPYGQPIPNYLWQSIVVTLLCCLPAGVVAIVYATRVQGLQQMGDIQGALDASQKAKTWCIVSAVAAVVILAIYLLIFFAVIGIASNSGD